MTPTIIAARRTIMVLAPNSNFPKLSDSKACQRFVDMKVKGLAADAVAAISSVRTVGRAA